MKYLCLGYHEEKQWDEMTQSEREAFVEECLAYDDLLRTGGHCLRGEALQNSRTATSLRYRNGAVVVTDGPFAETKEQLGGIMLIEAKDLNHAIQLLSKHPCMRIGGCFELRPVNEELTQEIGRRSSKINEECV